MGNLRLKIAPTLSMYFGLLVFMAVGIVLIVQWTSSRKIVADLSGRVITHLLDGVEQGVVGHLQPVRHQVEGLARLIETDSFGLGDMDRLQAVLAGSMTALPHVGGVILLDPNYQGARIRRRPQGDGDEFDLIDATGDEQLKEVLAEADQRTAGYWGAPYFNPENKKLLVNFRRPLRR